MRWRPTIYLGRWAGVELRLDLILVVLIGLLFFSSLNDASVANAPAGEIWTAVAHLVLLLALVLCMFLHEVGHAVMCKLRGHQPKMILLSFVGLTFFNAKNAKPSDEFWIAISGPMVNVAIAAATAPFIFIHLADRSAPPLATQAAMATLAGFMSWLSILNFLVAVGNLTPGWPADGARAVRARLAKKYGYGAGTLRAVAISHGFWLCLSGFSVIIVTLTQTPVLDFLKGPTPTRSSVAMVVMYNVVFLVMAMLGLYYGWAEKRRVARLGAEKASEVVGPPPEFMPGKERRAPASGPDGKTIDATVVAVDGKPTEPMAKPAEPSRIDEIKDKAKETLNTGKTLYKVAKATGKGGGWFARQGFKLVGAMFKGDDKYEKKPDEGKK
jgi:Zn-dependent protease